MISYSVQTRLQYINIKNNVLSFPITQQPNAGKGPLLRFLDDTQCHTIVGRASGRVIGPSQRPDNTQWSREREIHAPGGIRTRTPNKLSAVDPRLRPLGHEEQLDTQHLCNACRKQAPSFGTHLHSPLVKSWPVTKGRSRFEIPNEVFAVHYFLI
jgi:hypothetical protein